MRKTIFLAATLALLGAATLLVPRSGRSTRDAPAQTATAAPTPTPDRTEAFVVEGGDTFGTLAARAEVGGTDAQAVLAASEQIHTFAELRVGQPLAFTFSATDGRLVAVSYEPNREDIVTVRRTADGWTAEEAPIPYEVRTATAKGEITSSLWEAMLAQGDDGQLAIALAEVFAWQVDFAVDVRVGDAFAVAYEQRFRNGKYVMPGEILTARFTNDGTTYRAYHFSTDGVSGYFDEQGHSLQRVFLKSPLTYRYISSGFTGRRWDPISKKITAHYAIDYAAPMGTPTVAVGDGVVVQAGWNNGYGISLTVRHNETFTTRYGHFSRLAKGMRTGTKVSQGQVIGYVGSTGHSTGPHLHYEMYKYGTKVNPFTVELPAGVPVPEAQQAAFLAE
ncbi:MAG: peptidoglycan DD-metalloendopeptidase family protein, partial [bacterium]|nr:peptidoglycan DD-metalloendopeptidase family protein [bacterium]